MKYQGVYRLLLQNSSLRKFIFHVYYLYFVQDAIATLRLSKAQSDTVANIAVDSPPYRAREVVAKATDKTWIDQEVIARLEENFTYGPSNMTCTKIMPLGDSQTSGVRGNHDRDSGGYRTELWRKFMADGLTVDFVGSQSSGPASLGAKNHEGHGSWTIKQIAGSVDQWLDTYQPDLILLTIGLADTRNSPLRAMVAALSALIDQITTRLPNADLLVASLPPIHPAKQPTKRVLRALYFNAAVPYIVNMKDTQGKRVHFVDMRSLSLDDLTSSVSLDLDNGLHLNAQGYHKVANFWYNAVLKLLKSRHPIS